MPGDGRVVTGLFRHTAQELLEVYVEGLAEPIVGTPKHPYWSTTRQAFIEADALQIGEELETSEGRRCAVLNLVFRATATTVYNIEVHGDHVYHVSTLGILVHNASQFVAPDGGWAARKLLRRDVYLAQRPRDPYYATKHVSAATADEARDLSLGIGTYRGRPEASYLPEFATRVASLEKAGASSAIRAGNVFEHGGTRFLFQKFDTDLGYNNGVMTKWMLIHLTKSGKPTIHSYPIDLASVRQYIPGAV